MLKDPSDTFYDRGALILEESFPFIEGDEDIERLKARVHEKEHEAIVTGTKRAISRLKDNSKKPEKVES